MQYHAADSNKLDPELLQQRLAAMPKTEIHVHLEGATDPETVFRLARKNNISLPASTLEEWKAFFAFKNFAHFIDVYILSCTAFQTVEDWAFLVETFIKNQAAQNIRYCEAFISTSQHLKKFPKEDFLHALIAGAKAGENKHGTQLKIITDISREQPENRGDVLDFALLGKESGLVVGIGLGGLEAEFPPRLFADVYAEAQRQGLHIVAHAGEAAGPESIEQAIDTLQIERIGHGVRVLEDTALTERLAQSRIPFEVSPTSNYCLGIVPADQPHPIRKMIDAGLFCTVNSDDPTMFSTSLVKDYQKLASQRFSWQELWQLNCNTLEATFMPEAEKIVLRHQWQQFINEL